LAKFQPDGWHAVTPRIVVREPESLIDFINIVFQARGEFRDGLPAEMPYGDRRAMVKDRWGNVWQFATHQRDLSAAEIHSRLAKDE